jgi:hypothetical protein
MSDIEIIKKQIDELEEIANEIEKMSVEFLNKVPLIYNGPPLGVVSPFPDYEWAPLIPQNKSLQRDIIRKYQRFFSAGLHFVKEFLPEKEDEFKQCYDSEGYNEKQGIMDYFQFRRHQYSNDKYKIIGEFLDQFEIQRSILTSIPYVAKIKEMDLREIISADFINREIEEAEFLFKNHPRAAGALAGVALEKHLIVLCEKYQIDYQPKDTIEPLVQKLYKNGKLEISQMKNIQYLASIRNKCDHPEDVENREIKELIEKVKKLV